MNTADFENSATWRTPAAPDPYTLRDGSRVGVLGGGPAGSFFSLFVLDMAQRAGLQIHVDIYERRDFTAIGPSGCNMCGGIIAESLVQTLAAEGIIIPPSVVERGIDSYHLHTDEGGIRIEPPLPEKRIASVHRGGGPRGTTRGRWESFDEYLLELAIQKGAHLIRGKVDDLTMTGDRPSLALEDLQPRFYDLLVVAAGINTSILKAAENLGVGYRSPKSTGTCIAEFRLDPEALQKHLGNAMHVFLLHIPRVEFFAIVPKGEFATVCLLGRDIDREVLLSVLHHPRVRSCFPADWAPSSAACQCFPRMTVRGARHPYADRLVFIGDAGSSRLFKDGIGSAYRTAKAAAATAVFQGVSARHFRKHYRPVCRRVDRDNLVGRAIFVIISEFQRHRMNRRGLMRMAGKEQSRSGVNPRMSSVLWDTFSGSASYTDIFIRALHPAFVARLFASIVIGLVRPRSEVRMGQRTAFAGLIQRTRRDI